MLGGKELAQLHQQKQALILQSNLNRLTLRVQCQDVSQAVAPLASIGGLLPKRSALTLIVAPVAGLLLARSLRGSASWFGRAASAAKWIFPLYELWKRLSARVARDRTVGGSS
jgi:hypothetical protein